MVTLRSSGTTGEPKRLFFTAEDLELTVDFFGVGMSTLVRAGAKVLILLPGDKPDSVGDLLARGLERIGVEGIPHGPVKDVTLTMDRIISLGIDSLVGIPTQVLALARSTAGSIIPKGMVKDILLSTDYVPSAIVRGPGGAMGLQGIQPLRHDGDGSWRRSRMRGPKRLSPPGGRSLF